MRTPRSSLLGRFSVFALFVFAASSVGLRAQGSDQMELARLSDAIARKMVPLVKMQAETRAAMMASQQDAAANIGDIFVATNKSKKPIASGQEVLDAMRSYSDQVLIPEGLGLTFLPLTSKGWFDSTGMMFAVFTFGLKGDDVLLDYFEKTQTDPNNGTWGAKFNSVYNSENPAMQKAEVLFKKVDAFYRSKGFKVIGSKGIKFYWQSPDGLVAPAFDLFNDMSRVAAKVGEKVPSGPIVTLQMAPQFSKPTAVMDPMPDALAKAGLSQEDYTGYLNALFLAFRDTGREAELDSPNVPGLPDAPPDASQELIDQLNEAKAAYAKSMGPLLEIRKANLAIYKKYADRLETYLKQLADQG